MRVTIRGRKTPLKEEKVKGCCKKGRSHKA